MSTWVPYGTVPGMVTPEVARVTMANITGASNAREVAISVGQSLGWAQGWLVSAGRAGLVNYGDGRRGLLQYSRYRIVEDWGPVPI